ncbi:MAG: flagellar biosynthesis anti-sigma factor FlgM [Termitinemataceae bacterium]|nr:MAG: flagellar biosynthesis anti-sigma factor FlgM [Termitinemataceae bacterium]
MTIGRVGSLDHIEPVKPGSKVIQPVKTNQSDSVSISNEALKKSDFISALEIVKAAPDVRADRVAEMKAKINDPSYITETLLNGTVDKIVDMLWPDSIGEPKLKLPDRE